MAGALMSLKNKEAKEMKIDASKEPSSQLHDNTRGLYHGCPQGRARGGTCPPGQPK